MFSQGETLADRDFFVISMADKICGDELMVAVTRHSLVVFVASVLII